MFFSIAIANLIYWHRISSIINFLQFNYNNDKITYQDFNTGLQISSAYQQLYLRDI